jgi:hypothetical protein
MPKKQKKNNSPKKPIYIDTSVEPIHENDEKQLFENFDVNNHKFDDNLIINNNIKQSNVPVIFDDAIEKMVDMENEMEHIHKQSKKTKSGTRKKRKSLYRYMKKRKNTRKK